MVEPNGCELSLIERRITELDPSLMKMSLTRVILCHNALMDFPECLLILANLKHLNLFNNELTALPKDLNRLKRLEWLNLGMNKLDGLPSTFGNLTNLVHLDLSLNRFRDDSFPPTFFTLPSLERLYLSNNLIETLGVSIIKLQGLQTLALRDNRISRVSKDLKDLLFLFEIHLQGNKLRFLPPEFADCPELNGNKSIVKLEGNPWILPIKDQLRLGVSHVMTYIKSSTYKFVYDRHHV
ncbi:ras suppressor protein 1-like [Tigriopus californicus]|uniref:ras suppressor protein 1-like n=1 Tax=Tigriopus californicus TaxID=6832 RepID=UPI0027DA1295|nr:ras suppressor protein 1-like [Tigriopus californicus]